jgi:hypothetical protein
MKAVLPKHEVEPDIKQIPGWPAARIRWSALLVDTGDAAVTVERGRLADYRFLATR